MYLTVDSGRSRRSGYNSKEKKYALYTIWGTSKCAATSKTVHRGKPVIKIIAITMHAFQVKIKQYYRLRQFTEMQFDPLVPYKRLRNVKMIGTQQTVTFFFILLTRHIHKRLKLVMKLFLLLFLQARW